MKEGGEVRYFEPDGEASHHATITDIPGAGPSHRKLLNLRYRKDGENVEVEAVPHELDIDSKNPPTNGFWLMVGERRHKREWAEEAEQPKADGMTPAVRQATSRSTRGTRASTTRKS